jgi:hypothetical protein
MACGTLGRIAKVQDLSPCARKCEDRKTQRHLFVGTTTKNCERGWGGSAGNFVVTSMSKDMKYKVR